MQQYTRVPNYLAAIIQSLPSQKGLAHKSKWYPLYRGIPAAYLNLDTYKKFQHYYWTSFTSTSRNRKVAEVFAGEGGIVFKITVAENKPYTNITLPSSWSNAPEEEEVLLMPNFCFTVVSKKKGNDGFTEVVIMEVPYQNYLDYDQFNYPRVVWLDLQVFNQVNTYHQRELKRKFINIIFTKNPDKAIRELSTCRDSILIISGSLGQTFVPRAHSIPSLRGIAIYCLRTSFHKKWSSEYKKVGVVTSSVHRIIDRVLERQRLLAEAAPIK